MSNVTEAVFCVNIVSVLNPYRLLAFLLQLSLHIQIQLNKSTLKIERGDGLLLIINNGNRGECSPIRSVSIRVIIGPLHDPVTWYKITYAGEQVAQRDFQNKGRSRWTGTSCFVLEVPLCNLYAHQHVRFCTMCQ